MEQWYALYISLDFTTETFDLRPHRGHYDVSVIKPVDITQTI